MSFVDKAFSIFEAVDTGGFFTFVAVSLFIGLIYAVVLILLGV